MHTPGPWEVSEPNSHNDLNGIGVRSEDFIVADVWGDVAPLAEARDANARLIAAAPDLLEALKLMLRLAETINPDCAEEDEIYDAARAVIAKAEGK